MASAEKKITQMTNDTNKQIAADTNQANKDIAQMNNDFNLQMLDKQIEYNKAAYAQQFSDTKQFTNEMFDKNTKNQWDMWNATNAYNDPSAQMQRLSDAGLNPYMSQISPGSATATSSSSGQYSAPQMSGVDTPTATPYQAVGYQAIKPDVSAALNAAIGVTEQVGNIFNNYFDNNLKEVQRRNLESAGIGIGLDNELKQRTMASSIGSALAGMQGQQLQNDYQKIVNSFTPTLMSGQANNLALTNQSQFITNAMLDVNLQWLPLEKRLQAGSYAADIATKIQQGRLTGEQIQTEKRRAELTMYQSQGEKWNVEQKQRMQQYFDDAIKYGSIPSPKLAATKWLADDAAQKVTDATGKNPKEHILDLTKGLGNPFDKDYPYPVWWLPHTWHNVRK